MTELRECPFCGDTVHLEPFKGRQVVLVHDHPQDSECWMADSVPLDWIAPESALEDWNKRQPSPAVVELVEAAREVAVIPLDIGTRLDRALDAYDAEQEKP